MLWGVNQEELDLSTLRLSEGKKEKDLPGKIGHHP
jgi:hypothetical protein